MIEARVEWDGPWRGPLAPELHGLPPRDWTVRWLDGSRREVRRAFACSHRLRAFGWPAPRPLGYLTQGRWGRLLLSDDVAPLPPGLAVSHAASLGRLLRLLAELRIEVPGLSWPSLGLRREEVVPLDLLGARRRLVAATPRHLSQLRREDLPLRAVIVGLRAAAADRPRPRAWARQWLRALSARGDTRSAGL